MANNPRRGQGRPCSGIWTSISTRSKSPGRPQPLDAFAAVLGRFADRALEREEFHRDLAVAFGVVDDQEPSPGKSLLACPAAGCVSSPRWPGRRPNETTNQNSLPSPGALSTPISPPISPTIRLLIASPRPVPPKLLVCQPLGLDERLEQPSEMLLRDSDPGVAHADPQRTLRAAAFERLTEIVTSPRSVNFTAFPTRLVRT